MNEPTWTCEQRSAKKVIQAALAALNDALGEYEQTTHGCLFTEGDGIRGVCAQLAKAYEHPSAYNISNLSQYIAAFLKRVSGPTEPPGRQHGSH